MHRWRSLTVETNMEICKRFGTRLDVHDWVFHNPEFLDWRAHTNKNLLWVKGGPGKGKTMLLCGLINELQRTGKQDDTDQCVCYFFCQATDSELNHSVAVLRGLVYQLVDRYDYLLKHIRPLYRRAGRGLFYDKNSWFALTGILKNILCDSDLPETTLVIDALDECGTGLPRLLDFITSTSSSHSAKWIVSSRYQSNLESHLNIFTRGFILDLEVNGNSVSDTVRVYIRHKVERLARLKEYDPELQDRVQRYLVRNSDNTFLWVALVCQELEDSNIEAWDTDDKLDECLSSFPAGLEPLYLRMMSQLGENKAAKHILGLMSVVYRPVTLLELKELVDPSQTAPARSLGRVLPRMIKSCGCFLIVRDETVYFIHQSAKDFLLSHKETSTAVFPEGVSFPHGIIYRHSLESLGSTLSRNIYNLLGPAPHQKNTTPPEPDPFRGARYSCVHWIDHLIDGQRSSPGFALDNLITLTSFMKRHFLHWLEALSLLDSIDKGMSAILNLDRKLQRPYGGFERYIELKGLFRDAARFIQYHKHSIESSPLQLYSSALLFSPRKNVIRQLYQEEEPDWILQKPQVEEGWDSCIQTLQGHLDEVNEVTWSQDGQKVASASWDGTIKVWNALTGRCLQTLKSDGDEACSLRFDGDDIVSLHFDQIDKSFKICDTERGVCRRPITIKGRGSCGLRPSLSPNGRRAALLLDGKIQVLDATTGFCTLAIEDDDLISSMEVGDDYLATAMSTGTIKIWVCDNNIPGLSLATHGHFISCMAFSPCDNYLAACSGDMIQVWDLMERGVCTQAFKVPPAQKMVFSPNSDLLALSTHTMHNGQIYIWRLGAETGYHVTTQGGQSILSPEFSPDSARVASPSSGGTIKIWDLAAVGDESISNWNDHEPRWCNTLALTENGQTLAWSSETKIEIFDVDMGHCVGILRPGLSNPLKEIQHLTFDRTGCQLVITAPKFISLLNVETGECWRTFESSTQDFGRAALTPQGGHVVSSSSSPRQVLILDVKTGLARPVPNRTLQRTSFLAFSPPEKGSQQLVASVSLDFGEVYVWDLEDGVVLRTLQVCDIATGWVADALGYTGYSVNEDGSWIVLNGEPLMAIPPDFRPIDSSYGKPCLYCEGLVANASRTLAIGSSKRGCIFMKFDT